MPLVAVRDSASFKVIDIDKLILIINIEVINLSSNWNTVKNEMFITKINFSLSAGAS